MGDENALTVGDRAPDFLLKDQHGREVRLSDLTGRRLLLSWHPLAWTRVCGEQMRALDKLYPEFEKLGVTPFGLSVDTVASKHAWAKELRMERLRLLSDFWPHGAAAAAMGVFRAEAGFSERANFILDAEQRVVFRRVYDLPVLPDIEEVLGFLGK
jgi:peroxiredoxin